MTNVTTLLGRTHQRPEELSIQIADVLATMDQLLCSADPAVVFSSVARLCVPILCDVATVTMAEDGQQPYSIRWPSPGPRDTTPDDVVADNGEAHHRVFVPIRSRAPEEADRFSGTLELRYDGYEPSPGQEMLALLVAERASAVIDQERLAERVRVQLARGDNLEVGMASNRDIGIAIGIVMGAYILT
jgi:GAF domain-containing protein